MSATQLTFFFRRHYINSLILASQHELLNVMAQTACCSLRPVTNALQENSFQSTNRTLPQEIHSQTGTFYSEYFWELPIPFFGFLFSVQGSSVTCIFSYVLPPLTAVPFGGVAATNHLPPSNSILRFRQTIGSCQLA